MNLGEFRLRHRAEGLALKSNTEGIEANIANVNVKLKHWRGTEVQQASEKSRGFLTQ
ncbi:hypothetical protein AB6K26_004579 [Salmonella enterica]|nr:hypothetical protein [Salmonella enterica subsp. houtenae]